MPLPLLLAGALVVVGVAMPRAAATNAEAAISVWPSDDCPRLFGTPGIRKKNQRARKRTLHWVRQSGTQATVGHAHPRWTQPVHWQGSGFTLLADPAAGAGIVRISPRLAERAGCSPGVYRLQRDDALGANARVLDVLDGAVLVELGGRLGYLAPPGQGKRLSWLVVWGSTYTVPRPLQPSKAAPKPPRGKKRKR